MVKTLEVASIEELIDVFSGHSSSQTVHNIRNTVCPRRVVWIIERVHWKQLEFQMTEFERHYIYELWNIR